MTKPTGSVPKPPSPDTPYPFRRYLWPLKRQELLKTDLPILVGPFRTEVGFEALYWLPFLERLKADGVDPARIIPIGRGGSAQWYGCPVGLELYGMRSLQQVRVENRMQRERYNQLKQVRNTPFDRAVIKDAAKTLGLTRYLTLHPSWMYHALQPYWEGQAGLAWLSERTQFATIPTPPLPGTLTLPEQFFAVRFYIRPTLPPAPLVLQLVSATVQRLAAQAPVILIHHKLFVDDHSDVPLKGLANVSKLSDMVSMTPETHLAVQSAVLARCTAFVGTYGGFAQLALRFGRPVVSFYENWGGTALAHKHLADGLSVLGKTPFQVWSLNEIGLAQAALPIVEVKQKHQPVAQPEPEPVVG